MGGGGARQSRGRAGRPGAGPSNQGGGQRPQGCGFAPMPLPRLSSFPTATPPSLRSTLSAPSTRTATAPSTSGSSSVPFRSPPAAASSRNSTGPLRCTTWTVTGASRAWRCWRSSRYAGWMREARLCWGDAPPVFVAGPLRPSPGTPLSGLRSVLAALHLSPHPASQDPVAN